MQKFQLSAVTSPSIEFECGGHVKESNVIKSTKKNPNFTENILFFDVVSCWVLTDTHEEGWDQSINDRNKLHLDSFSLGEGLKVKKECVFWHW